MEKKKLEHPPRQIFYVLESASGKVLIYKSKKSSGEMRHFLILRGVLGSKLSKNSFIVTSFRYSTYSKTQVCTEKEVTLVAVFAK